MGQADLQDISPAERRRLKVRDAILEAAEHVFAREGEAGLSIRRIAEDIDYSPAAIYKYFGSKDELVDELKETFFQRILKHVARVNASDAPFHERARDCVETYIRVALEKPHHYAAAFAGVKLEPTSTPKHADDAFQNTAKSQAFQHLVAMVEEGQAIGYFNADVSAVMAAKSVWAASHGLATLFIHVPDFCGMAMQDADTAMERDAFIELHANLTVCGLRKRSAGDDRPAMGEDND